MKGKEIIELVRSRNLNLFNFSISFTDGYNIFPNIVGFAITDIFESTDGNLFMTGVNDDRSIGMTGNEIIDRIENSSLELKDSIFVLGDSIDTKNRKFKIVGLADIGYSDNVVILETEEIIEY